MQHFIFAASVCDRVSLFWRKFKNFTKMATNKLRFAVYPQKKRDINQ